MWFGASRQEVYIVVEIGELPVERWRVGQHAQIVFIENALPVDDLQHDLAARRLGEPPMHGRGARIESMDMYPCNFGLNLIDGGAAPENVGDQLEIRYVGLIIRF